MARYDGYTETVSLMVHSSQEENYPKSLCKRSLFYRPLPDGKKSVLHFITAHTSQRG